MYRMYVCVYKYRFIPSGCINIWLMSYLFIYKYIYSLHMQAAADTRRFCGSFCVIFSWSWTAAFVSARTTSQRWTSRSMKAVSRSMKRWSKPSLMNSAGFFNVFHRWEHFWQERQPKNLHEYWVPNMDLRGGLEISINFHRNLWAICHPNNFNNAFRCSTEVGQLHEVNGPWPKTTTSWASLSFMAVGAWMYPLVN